MKDQAGPATRLAPGDRLSKILQHGWGSAWLGALLAAVALLGAPPGLAAPGPAVTAPVQAWPQANSDVAADPAVRFGTLPNGMRYAIMRNATPKAEVSIRFRIDAGSLMETQAQAGLAHMIEHMTFRGTVHVPQAEEWKGLQRLGMAMGADVSAFTSDTQTFYQFDLPNADPKTLDTGLMRMRETASEVLLRPEALDAERGTVLSEMRTRDTPGYRTSRAELGFFYAGQPLATHAPIGSLDNIQHAPAEALRAFYRAYYRPERASLIVVGDIDPDLVERRIRAHFANWTGVGPPGPEPVLGPPAQRGEETRLVVDPALSRAIAVGWITPYDTTPENRAKVRRTLIESIGLAVLNHRLQRLASRPDRPFLSAQVSSQNQARSARIVALNIDIDPTHWRGALTAADIARRQALQFGVRQDEVDREIATFRAQYQAAADGAATRPTPLLASGLLGSADEGFVFADPAEALTLVQAATEGLTADQVTDALRGLFVGSGPLLFIASPVAIDGGQAAVTAAFDDAESRLIASPPAETDLVWPYANFGPAGQVVEQRSIEDLGVTLVRFANGVRLTIKPTKLSADQILVQAKIGQGRRELPSDRGAPRWAADGGALVLGGLKAMSFEDMQQVLAAKVYGVSYGTLDDGFVLAGATTPSDLDTQLQVLAAYVTAPGWRQEAFDRTRAGAAPQLNNLAASPDGVMARDLGMLLHDGDPRWAPATPLELTFARLADLRATLGPVLAGDPIELTIVGDVSVDRAIAAAAASFGALPPRPDPDAPPDSAGGGALPRADHDARAAPSPGPAGSGDGGDRLAGARLLLRPPALARHADHGADRPGPAVRPAAGDQWGLLRARDRARDLDRVSRLRLRLRRRGSPAGQDRPVLRHHGQDQRRPEAARGLVGRTGPRQGPARRPVRQVAADQRLLADAAERLAGRSAQAGRGPQHHSRPAARHRRRRPPRRPAGARRRPRLEAAGAADRANRPGGDAAPGPRRPGDGELCGRQGQAGGLPRGPRGPARHRPRLRSHGHHRQADGRLESGAPRPARPPAVRHPPTGAGSVGLDAAPSGTWRIGKASSASPYAC